MTLDLNYYKQIAERVKAERLAERAEALRRKDEPEITPEVQEETQERDASPETAEPKKDYVYVPALGLYISENRYLQNKDWNQTQEILHKEGRRMPTIPEFIEFSRYLKSNERKTKVKNAGKILDEIYTVRAPGRAEWLDADFKVKGKKLYVNYYVFENNKIVPKTEQLENYLDETRNPGIDLDSWLANSTKQGLPRVEVKGGSIWYGYPREGAVAGFGAGSVWAGLYCGGSPGNHGAGLGVRYVEPIAMGEDRAKKNK
ncbi:MAG: hypothetical protein Q8L27_00500 [archaeon]|nr:hypothetical protein [archaeon]